MNTYTSYKLSDIPGFTDLNYNHLEEGNSNIKLNSVVCKTENGKTYKIIRYDKTMLNTSLIRSFGLCRSVVVDEENYVVCFSPPKSIDASEFITYYPIMLPLALHKPYVKAEEFVEGTMINVFWDSKIGLNGAWEIATRNNVGAMCSFFKTHNDKKNKTFRTMFLEAMEYCKFTLDMLDKLYCYSFVLQHPENRIVIPFKNPQLYLVAMYQIINTSEINDYHNGSTNVYRIDYTETYNRWINAGCLIRIPELYSFDSYNELIDKYASMNTPYNIVGVVFYHFITGERCKVRNPVYEQVKQLRGNQPKLQYRYLSVRKEGKMKEFLNFYPENKKIFSDFRDQVHLFTNTLYTNYVSCYIKKEKPLNEFAEQYKTHMYHIHRIYLNELKDKKLYVNNTVVQKYVNELEPSLLMYCLNFHMRKRNVDFMKVDEPANIIVK